MTYECALSGTNANKINRNVKRKCIIFAPTQYYLKFSLLQKIHKQFQSENIFELEKDFQTPLSYIFLMTTLLATVRQ